MISGLKIPKLIRWIFSIGIIFLIIMTLLRLSLYLFFNDQGNRFRDILDSLWLGIRFDLRMVCILLTVILVVGSFKKLDPFNISAGKKICFVLITAGAFLLVFFYSVDFAHYSYLGKRLNASILNYLSDAGISLNMVWQSYPVIRITLVLFAGTFLIRWLSLLAWKKIKQDTGQVKRKTSVLSFCVALLLFGICIFGRLGQFPLRWSDAFALGSDYKANLALNPFQSFFSSMKFRHSNVDVGKVKKAFPILAPYYGFLLKDSSILNFDRIVDPVAGNQLEAPNIVIVICESFSAYKSSMWGNPLKTTPFFNEMTTRGIFFDHCFTPSYGTARGVWAVITGIPDVEISTTTSSRNPSAVDQHTIMNDFSGYDKFYFLGGSTSWANIRGLLTNNIDGLHLYEQQDYDAPKIDVWGISDKNLFLQANKVLKEQTKPFIAIIQTADNHRPYTIPKEDLAAFHPISFSPDSLKEFGFESNDEMNAFRYTDFGYQTFMEAAGKEKYFDNTIFLFIGDHGIPGEVGNMFPKAWTLQRLSAEHVPLLIYAPKLIPARRISDFCSQLDVLPTLAGLAHIGYRNTTLGRDLLDSAAYAGKAFSFVYDPDEGYIGILKGNAFYRKQVGSSKEEMVSVVDNLPVPDNPAGTGSGKEMSLLAEGVYETSKYLILNNKKNK